MLDATLKQLNNRMVFLFPIRTPLLDMTYQSRVLLMPPRGVLRSDDGELTLLRRYDDFDLAGTQCVQYICWSLAVRDDGIHPVEFA
jgi:hypothetical protein